MQCHELSDQLSQWRTGEEESFAIVVDDGDVVFRKHSGAVIVSTVLNTPAHDEALLQDALRLAHPSLSRFPGALARSAEDGRLWLLARMPSHSTGDDLLALLEPLLNQRDSWVSMLASERPAARARIPRSTLSPAFNGKGIHHA